MKKDSKITKQEAEKVLTELRQKELKEAEQALIEWSKKYSVTIDVEFVYTPEGGFQKGLRILDISKK